MHTSDQILQSIHIPRHRVKGSDAVFFKDARGASEHNIDEGTFLTLSAEGHISFATYANLLPASQWKEINPHITFGMTIIATGHFSVLWYHIDSSGDVKNIHRQTFQSEVKETFSFACPWIDALKEGLVFIEIDAIKETSFSQVFFTHNIQPLRPCHLAIVITHFQREKQVASSLQKLSGICGEYSPDASTRIIVIDNSQTLPASLSGPLIHILPNANLGGAGGFSRGLLEAASTHPVTHCLFMDDDASCTTESVQRSIQAVRLSTKANTCVAGAMLLEDRPTVLHEAGATVNGLWQPVKHNIELSNTPSLIEASTPEEIHYGGWWFYLFPIASVTTYPFPFFVRGDDVGFGLTNDFHIITLPGICSWQEDFSEKQSPLTTYLDTRARLVLALAGTYPDSHQRIRKILRNAITKNNGAYLYASAQAGILAAQDTLRGSEFFSSNPDLSQRIDVLRRLNEREFQRPWVQHDPACADGSFHAKNQSALDAPWSWKGHPLKNTRTMSTPFILYKNKCGEKGFIVERNLLLQVRHRLHFIGITLQFLWKQRKLQQDYGKAFKRIATKDFWQKTIAKHNKI